MSKVFVMKNGTVDLLLQVGKLKSLKRTGWTQFAIPDPESVAEHIFRICFLIFLFADKLGVSKERLYEMTLVHDIEEIETGDPKTQRGREDIAEHDYRLEMQIVKGLSSIEGAEKIYELWEAHLPQNKPGAPREASILYQLGKIATCWQALEYDLAGADPEGNLEELWENARVHIKESLLVELLQGLEARRKR